MGGLLGLLETGRESASTMRTRRKFITLRLAGWPLKEEQSDADVGDSTWPFLEGLPSTIGNRVPAKAVRTWLVKKTAENSDKL